MLTQGPSSKLIPTGSTAPAHTLSAGAESCVVISNLDRGEGIRRIGWRPMAIGAFIGTGRELDAALEAVAQLI